MAHIFFKRLERRYSTQSLFPWGSLPDLGSLDRLAGQSLQSQTQNLKQFYQIQQASYNFLGQANLYPQAQAVNWYPMGQQANWNIFNMPALPYMNSWTSPFSSWIPSWTGFTDLWNRQTYSWPLENSLLPDFPQALQGFIPVIKPQSTPWSSFSTYTQWGFSQSEEPPPYPPGTRYGLIKRSNLKT